jgi:hypothetical protein
MMRTAKEVLEDHLNLSKHGTIEEDLKRNYAEDVLLLTTHGIYKGHEGLKKLMEMLRKEVPDASYEYKKFLQEGEVGFLEWSCFSKKAKVEDGADSYIIRDGRIVAQTIHYTVTPKDGPE